MPQFQSLYGLKGAVISAVDIIKGIAGFLDMDIIKVPGITGDVDTNYKNKAKYALKGLKKYDFIFVHIEAPDETGHRGDYKEKVKAIEDIDKYIVGEILKNTDNDTILILLPDHPTPCKVRTHTSDPVPFVVFYKEKKINKKYKKFTEKICEHPNLYIKNGYNFLSYIVNEVK